MTEISSSESARFQSGITRIPDEPDPERPECEPFTSADSYGRYRVIRSLGRGGFGQVLLAQDPTLDRSVAIKVPKHHRALRPEIRARFIEEGRSLARMTHPAVVAVYDVGVSERGFPFVVMEFVSGQSLSQRMKSQRISLGESLDILLQVADGLKAMHQAQVVHRDLKPGNIVLDDEGRVRIIDFGLALNDGIPLRQLGRGQEGTPAYMAPEQVRGLNHHLDGRTDIWSFGVTMYQMMTGRLPFGGRKAADLGYRICSVEPLLPRQLNNEIPVELERVCLRCLAKSMSDRYETVADLQRDLAEMRMKLLEASVDDQVGLPAPFDRQEASNHRSDPQLSARSTTANVMTHGLRAFTQSDSAYFFELLPGQRNSQGVPETILFWQHRLSGGSEPSEHNLSVGLIYGPSGCGKTSFVRAGLLPRLTGEFDVIYIECDPRQTEARLGRKLSQKFPALGAAETIDEKLRLLRLESGAYGGRRTLIVLDQFEQWLRPPRRLDREPLVEALRQLDGARTCCLILVRDDYWMGITQLMRVIDQRIQEGINAMAYPLFDRPHAEKVLTAFGQSLNCLPRDPHALTKSQHNFISSAVKSFSRNGKVICVHLAMFAQMMRDRRWEASELKRAGGWKGVGVRFLEETFSDPEAPRTTRRFSAEAAAVLERLLPAGKRDVKGGMIAESELKQVAKLEDREYEFEQLLEVLCDATRLISQVDGGSPSESSQRHYQLSHDFLVGPIHEWLGKQRLGSWRGRAQIRLNDLAREWLSTQDDRFLPTSGEWLATMLGVPARIRAQHSKFIAEATKRLALRWSIAGLAVIGVLFTCLAVINDSRRRTGQAQAESLLSARPGELRNALTAVGESYFWARRGLDRLLEPGEAGDWRIYLARLQNRDRVDDSLIHLLDSLERMPNEEVALAVEALIASGQSARGELERRIASARDPQMKSRLATVLLFMGQDQFAKEALSLGPDPTVRTLFIKNFGGCIGELEPLANLVRMTNHRDFQSGLCLAVGRLPPHELSTAARTAWLEAFTHIYLNSPAAGSHSAAQWALRQWKANVPKLAPEPNAPREKDWWVVELSPGHTMTFVRVPGGSIVAGESVPQEMHKVNLKIELGQSLRFEPFWISTEEVNRALFIEYLKSKANAEPGQAISLPLSSSELTGRADWTDDEMPVSNITWNEAALFCNWINEQTRRAACYDQMNPETACDTSVQGFRMPLRAESEYAGLARAKTIFPFGGMEQMESLQDYSWYLSATVAPKSNTCPSGYKMPNGWGLFDVIGNANEWCSDGKADDNLSRYCQGGHNQCAMNELLLGLPSIDMRTSRQCEGIRLVLRTE